LTENTTALSQMINPSVTWPGEAFTRLLLALSCP
jgi:hypothetical protein